jgi:hypothetical protein
MNIDENKRDCTDSLIFGIGRVADWRKTTAEKYPTDLRNLRAYESLTTLANEAADLSDYEWRLLQPHYGWNDHWREGISKTARLVGFKIKIRDIHSFVQALIEVLSQPVAVS